MNVQLDDGVMRVAEVWLTRGIQARLQGRFVEAVAWYQRATALNPLHVDAFFNLGNALLVLHRWDEASAEYGVATRLKPEFAEAHFNWGTTLSQQGRLDEARGRFRQAARLRPEKWWWRLREVLLWPPVFQSRQEIEELRGRLEAAVDRISAAGEHLAPVSGHYDELLGSGCFPPYGLAYQGANSQRCSCRASPRTTHAGRSGNERRQPTVGCGWESS